MMCMGFGRGCSEVYDDDGGDAAAVDDDDDAGGDAGGDDMQYQMRVKA